MQNEKVLWLSQRHTKCTVVISFYLTSSWLLKPLMRQEFIIGDKSKTSNDKL